MPVFRAAPAIHPDFELHRANRTPSRARKTTNLPHRAPAEVDFPGHPAYVFGTTPSFLAKRF
jgi:hypothetical protein